MVPGIIAGKLKDIKADYVFSFEVSPMTQVLAGISFAKKLGFPIICMFRIYGLKMLSVIEK